jgi:hypothetical protein
MSKTGSYNDVVTVKFKHWNVQIEKKAKDIEYKVRKRPILLENICVYALASEKRNEINVWISAID